VEAPEQAYTRNIPTLEEHVERYRRYVGDEPIDRVWRKAKPLSGTHVAHINSTFYGGGVAEILTSLSLLMNAVGIKTGWRLMRGGADFFSITKKWHNALQGDKVNLTRRKIQIYEETIWENSVRNHLDHDFVVVHDPQPLPLIRFYRKHSPWVWRCHIDLTNPDPELLAYLKPIIEMYDAVILTTEEYRQDLKIPQLFFRPAIDPFSYTNMDLSEVEIDERLDKYGIPTDLPILLQVARFDRWKNPQGAIEVFRKVRKEAPCTLVLLGNMAADDPEGQQVYESLLGCQEERLRIISAQDSALVNACQRRAAVVLQMSIREGFGLTVTEAMWKGASVVARRVGGIPRQIEDGRNGFLVGSEDEAVARALALLKDERLRRRLGAEAHKSVARQFLMIRLLENYLDLFSSFESRFSLKAGPPSA